MATHGSRSQDSKVPAGGGIVVVLQPNERAFTLRQSEFLTLLEGDPSRSELAYKDRFGGNFVTWFVAAAAFLPSVHWGAAFLQRDYFRIVAGLFFCCMTGISFVLWQIFRLKCSRQQASAYSRLREKIEAFFNEP